MEDTQAKWSLEVLYFDNHLDHDLMESKSMQAWKKRTRPYSSNDAERLKRRQKEKIQEFTDSYLIKEYEEK